ncbi:MAG: molybdopterin-dependent oxidoreductase [Spirochaetaceae bacterium]|jgi:CO/xanthine dehydrogenase Mo-binding subunit|nr:molybdopterin-dependent oxidoreductase [Spirochaetaceae bacterium]
MISARNLLFAGDFASPQMYYGTVLRTELSNGTIKKINCPKLPASYKLISAKDIPGKNVLPYSDFPLLIKNSIHYKGEAFALLIGPDKTKLEELAIKINIQVVTEEDKIAETSIERSWKNTVSPSDTGNNPDNRDTEAVYSFSAHTGNYGEPVCAAASSKIEKTKTEKKINLKIYCAGQTPFWTRKAVSDFMHLDESHIEIVSCNVGFVKNTKIIQSAIFSCYAALASLLTKHPVQMLSNITPASLDLENDYSSVIKLHSVNDKTGKFVSHSVSTQRDFGAFSLFKDEYIDKSLISSIGIYEHAGVEIEAQAVSSEKAPQSPGLSFGMAEGSFALETQVSRIAQALDLNPLEWRKNNLIEKKQKLVCGMLPSELPSCIDIINCAQEKSDFNRKWTAYNLIKKTNGSNSEENLRGIGAAFAFQGRGFIYPEADKTKYSIELRLEKDGSLKINTGCIVSSAEIVETWKGIAQSILDVEDIQFIDGSTKNTCNSGPSLLSRNISIMTKLISDACYDIRKLRFRDPLPIIVRPQKTMSKTTIWCGKKACKDAFSRLSAACSVIELEIRRGEWIPHIRNINMVIDAGKILLKSSAERNIRIQTMNALEIASGGLFEKPKINIHFIEGKSDYPKGLGELPLCCIPSSYVQAVSLALNKNFSSVPLTKEKIFEALSGGESAQKEDTENDN